MIIKHSSCTTTMRLCLWSKRTNEIAAYQLSSLLLLLDWIIITRVMELNSLVSAGDVIVSPTSTNIIAYIFTYTNVCRDWELVPSLCAPSSVKWLDLLHMRREPLNCWRTAVIRELSVLQRRDWAQWREPSPRLKSCLMSLLSREDTDLVVYIMHTCLFYISIHYI